MIQIKELQWNILRKWLKEKDILKDINALKRLRVQCEKGKKILSKNEKITINIYNFFNGHDLTIDITRTQFDEICEDFLYKNRANFKSDFN